MAQGSPPGNRQPQWLNGLLVEMGVALLLLDTEGIVVWANSVATENLGVLEAKPFSKAKLVDLVPIAEHLDTAKFVSVGPISLDNGKWRAWLRPATDKAPGAIMLWISKPWNREADLSNGEIRMFDIEKLYSIGQIAAGLAHEINNPLAGAIQSSQLLNRALSIEHPTTLKRLDDYGIDEKGREIISGYIDRRGLINLTDIVFDCSNRISSMINGILAFIRSKDFIREPCDPLRLVEQSLFFSRHDSSMRKIYGLRKVKIELDPAPQGMELICDPQQIHRALLNIIKIAAYRLHESGRMDDEFSPSIRFSFIRHDNGYASIEMVHNGLPIDDEDLSAIDSPPIEGNPESADIPLLLGICVVILKDMHGGTFAVHHDKDGERFRLTLHASRYWEQNENG